MDCMNADVFSPIHNVDEKSTRQSDGLSEFLKGPDLFQKKSVKSIILENAGKNTPCNNISSPKSCKNPQKKTAKSDVFSPIRNVNEKSNRQSDGLSEFLKGPDLFQIKSVKSKILETADENIPCNNISSTKSSKTHPKKTATNDVFSPIRNFDENSNRQSDGLSEFLKGPDLFQKKTVNSIILENSDEKTLCNSISSTNSSKTHQRKTAKSEIAKSGEVLVPSITIRGPPPIFLEKAGSLKKSKSEDASLSSKRNDESRKNRPTKAEDCNTKKHDSHSAKKDPIKFVKSSLQSAASAVSTASGSEEIKKVNEPSSVSQQDPFSLVKKMPFSELEKMINLAVSCQLESVQQTQWSLHSNVLRALNNIQDEVAETRAENAKLFKIIEQLLEQNRVLRTAVLARQ